MDPITAIGGISAGVGIARGVYDATGRGRARAKKEARKEAERMRVESLNRDVNSAHQRVLTDQANYSPTYYQNRVAGRENDHFQSYIATAPIADNDRNKVWYTGDISVGTDSFLDRARGNFA